MAQEQQSRRSPTRRQLLWAGAAVGLLIVAILIGYRYDITLWDWLKLLVVPAVIAGGGIWFNRQQRERELEIVKEQRERDVEIAERRAQEEALQAYLDQMSTMLIPNKDQPSLYKAQQGDSLSSVARARTLTVLPRLDGNRKARVVQFLIEATLVQGYKGRPPIVDLNGADLRGVSLHGANLHGTNLGRANLKDANLSGAKLSYANLAGAYLPGAILRGAVLRHASMRNTYLVSADLRDAKLEHAILREARLRDANLCGATLSYASMHTAKLKNADLERAKLTKVDLTNADLSGARHITDEVLEEQTEFLKGARMPRGSKHAGPTSEGKNSPSLNG